MFDTTFVIIGAGAVGLAIGESLTREFPEHAVTIIEKHTTFGQETSSRNSEVIHAGIYYPQNSLKAKLSVEGNRLLYDFCDRWDIPYKKCGKLIVASSSNELFQLEELYNRGIENGVDGLELLDQKEILAIEPNIYAEKAILSKNTGILDTHQYMKQLHKLIKNNGGILAYQHNVVGITQTTDGYTVHFQTPNGSVEKISTQYIINTAGLHSDKVATMFGDHSYQLYYCKGSYFTINPQKANLVSRLIYPIPPKEIKGLGIHLTKDLQGRIRLGPDTEYVDQLTYKVDEGKKDMFFNAARRYLPFLEYEDLQPDMSGIRPKLQGPDAPFHDFIIEETSKHFINLLGIESPGLTSSLAIGNYVTNLIKRQATFSSV